MSVKRQLENKANPLVGSSEQCTQKLLCLWFDFMHRNQKKTALNYLLVGVQLWQAEHFHVLIDHASGWNISSSNTVCKGCSTKSKRPIIVEYSFSFERQAEKEDRTSQTKNK